MPIIKSLLDLDLYKLTMNQVQWRRHRGVPAVFRLNNRTRSVDLLDHVSIEDVRREVDAVRALRVTSDEIAYLSTQGFDAEYLAWLRELRLPPLRVEARGRILAIEAGGAGEDWAEVSLWETLVLAIVNELYCRGVAARDGLDHDELLDLGRERLEAKIERLEDMPGIKIIEFGTRRRFSAPWQAEVLRTLQDRIPEGLAGTSNVHLARLHGLVPIGTYAHEMPMGYTAVDDDLRTGVARGHRRMMEEWFEEFGEARTIALTDTFGSEFFFRDFADLADSWRGLRHDSGDPFDFGERAIRFYEGLGIDPASKQIVFSDGLDIDIIVRLYERFAGRVAVSFGWGTNLTNDLGIKTLSLVMKLVEAGGRGTVKLSDNVNKAMGSPEDIAAAVRVFDYTVTEAQDLVV